MESATQTAYRSLDVVELGGGRSPSYHPNIDALHGDIQADLTRGIPLADASVRLLVCSDFFEHVAFEQGLALLKECWRVLKGGGSIDFTVPDIPQALSYHRVNPEEPIPQDLFNCLYGDFTSEWMEHKAWYGPGLLRYILEKEGWLRVETLFTEHGWPHQPKFRIRAWKP